MAEPATTIARSIVYLRVLLQFERTRCGRWSMQVYSSVKSRGELILESGGSIARIPSEARHGLN